MQGIGTMARPFDSNHFGNSWAELQPFFSALKAITAAQSETRGKVVNRARSQYLTRDRWVVPSLHITCPKRICELQHSNRMNCASSSQRFSTGFTRADAGNLALACLYWDRIPVNRFFYRLP